MIQTRIRLTEEGEWQPILNAGRKHVPDEPVCGFLVGHMEEKRVILVRTRT